jgi:hypothetical protein
VGLAAAALPLAIHLLFRRRPRPTPFPAIDFLLRARRENERRLRLRKVLLFLARTALLAGAALALARPELRRAGAPGAAAWRGPAATAIVLDASASMSYRLRGRSLLDAARGDALESLAALGGDEPATALLCDGRGRRGPSRRGSTRRRCAGSWRRPAPASSTPTSPSASPPRRGRSPAAPPPP